MHADLELVLIVILGGYFMLAMVFQAQWDAGIDRLIATVEPYVPRWVVVTASLVVSVGLLVLILFAIVEGFRSLIGIFGR